MRAPFWVNLKKDLCGEREDDIFIGTFYAGPHNNNNNTQSDFVNKFDNEINLYKGRGVILVQGDLNARTGSEKDFIEYDKYNDTLSIENYDNQHLRNSEDQKTNVRGRELLDICKLIDP